MEAIILAGGLGTRLRPVVADRPKVLAPVNGRPFLYWVLVNLARRGFSRVCLAIGYRGEEVVAALGRRIEVPSGGLEVIYSMETSPLGTGGALAAASRVLRAGGPIFALNGDTYLDLDWRGMLAGHVRAKARMSIAVREVNDRVRFGAIGVAGNRVVSFGDRSLTGPGLINAGVYVFEPEVFDLVANTGPSFSFEADVISSGLEAIAPIAFCTSAPFLDIGIPEDYRRADAFLALANIPDWSGDPS